MRPLSLLEARVLGVLVEKAHTVPDSYPLSLNALTLGCNQKTARDPVLVASEGEVQAAADALKLLSLTFESSGSRVSRYEHNMGRALALPSQSVALLAVLMLRGPQTTSELRANSERLHRFADVSAVEGFLDELAARPEEKGGPLAARLARAPGSREARWAQLLTGAVDAASLATAADGEDFVAVSELAALKARLAAAETEIAVLRSLLDRVCTELDISRA
ncbi:MAG: YceH family protein [Caldimonas sp.]